MAIILFIFIFLSGYLFVHQEERDAGLWVKVGLAFPIGLFWVCGFIFLWTLVGLPLNYAMLWIIPVFFTLLFGAVEWFKKDKLHFFKPQANDVPKLTFAWVIIGGVLIYVLYGAAEKALFWPITDYDSITGYDLMGKMIAHESTFKPSIFDYTYKTAYDVARFIYPPMVASAFAVAHLMGMANVKIIMVLWFVSFVIAFYGFLRKSVNDTVAIFITLLMAVTPEMFSHASLGLTNLPHAIYTCLTFFCIYEWMRQNRVGYFWVGFVLICPTMWLRSDSIVFLGGFAILFLLHFIHSKEWMRSAAFLAMGAAVFLVWSLYVKWVIGVSSADFFVKSIFFDADKFKLIFGKALTLIFSNTHLYGFTFYVFIVLLALNIVHVVVNINKLAVFILFSWLAYTLLYYQMDYQFAGNVDAYINASYKRGMFNFVPLAWFFVATNSLVQNLTAKMQAWLYDK